MESPQPPPLPAAPKPAVLTVFGIMNILFGVLGLVSALFTLKLHFTPLESQTGPMADLLRSNVFCATCLKALVIPGIFFVTLQIIAGIGLLRSSELARKTAVVCALYGIAAGIFVGWLNVRYILPFTIEQTLQQVKDPAVAAITRNVTQGAGYFGIVLGLLYPVLVVILLHRDKVRQYCIARSC